MPSQVKPNQTKPMYVLRYRDGNNGRQQQQIYEHLEHDFGDDYRKHALTRTLNCTTTHIERVLGWSCCATTDAGFSHITHTSTIHVWCGMAHEEMSHHPWKNPDNSSNCICVSYLVISLIRIHLVYDMMAKRVRAGSECVCACVSVSVKALSHPTSHTNLLLSPSLLLSSDGNHSIVYVFIQTGGRTESCAR